MVAIVSWLTRKPHIIYEDTERSTISLWFCKRVSKIIITPKYFKTDLGESHVKTDSFKELFYLHRKKFEPDSSVLKELDINEEDPFILIRYIAWNASHDFGEFGFSESGKIELLKKLSKKFRVFISSEEELPKELKKYELRVSAEKIHHVLYYASLFVSESGTMSTEACLLGTPVVYVATIAKKLGNFIELKERYDLLHFYDNEEDGWAKIQSITEKKSYKEQNKYKLDKLYQEKIDIEQLYYWAITNYPRSINILKDSCESNVLKQLPTNI
jgi:predicted glycosyltransferase